MGGLAPVVAQLLSPSPQLAAAAAHVLGTAASNNPKFQKALLTQHPHVLPTLLKVRTARRNVLRLCWMCWPCVAWAGAFGSEQPGAWGCDLRPSGVHVRLLLTPGFVLCMTSMLAPHDTPCS